MTQAYTKHAHKYVYLYIDQYHTWLFLFRMCYYWHYVAIEKHEYYQNKRLIINKVHSNFPIRIIQSNVTQLFWNIRICIGNCCITEYSIKSMFLTNISRYMMVTYQASVAEQNNWFDERWECVNVHFFVVENE